MSILVSLGRSSLGRAEDAEWSDGSVWTGSDVSGYNNIPDVHTDAGRMGRQTRLDTTVCGRRLPDEHRVGECKALVEMCVPRHGDGYSQQQELPC